MNAYTGILHTADRSVAEKGEAGGGGGGGEIGKVISTCQ